MIESAADSRSIVRRMKPSLQPLVFRHLPPGSVQPRGWLGTQLRTQARGLTGHLDEFWPDVQDSAWIGGDGDGWERGPYWLDGLIPLTFVLDDERVKTKANDGWMQSSPGRPPTVGSGRW